VLNKEFFDADFKSRVSDELNPANDPVTFCCYSSYTARMLDCQQHCWGFAVTPDEIDFLAKSKVVILGWQNVILKADIIILSKQWSVKGVECQPIL